MHGQIIGITNHITLTGEIRPYQSQFVVWADIT